MESLLQDLRFAVKVLIKRPLFTAAAVITLALGIGANSAVFSVINSVLLSPLPYPEADQLVMAWQSLPAAGMDEAPASPANFADWREQNQVFEDMAAFSTATLTLRGSDEPQAVQAGMVTPGFFQLLRVEPEKGRVLRANADGAAAQEVLLGYPLWSRRFGADPNIVGQVIQLDQSSYEVVGVLPAEFRFTFDADLWLPQIFSPEELGQRLALSQLVIGRLKDGVSLQQARSNMDNIALQLGEEFPMTNGDWDIRLVPLRDYVIGDIGASLWILFGVVAFVLLVACANVASLLLARAAEREKEFAMRQALGADRLRLIRQALTESVVLALVGASAGLALAALAIAALIKVQPAGIPRIEEVGLDPVVLLFTLAVAVFTGLLFGLLPALQSPKAKLSEMMKEGLGASSASGGALSRLRSSFVVIEIALALALLIGAGLTVRSFQRLQEVDPGFRPAGTLIADLVLPDGSYTAPAQRVAFFDQVLEQLRRIPALEEVAYATSVPLSGREEQQLILIEGRPPNPRVPDGAGIDAASPGYFKTMGIELVGGRTFSERDRGDSAAIAVINEAMAEHYWPGENALGKRLTVPGVSGEPREVVGVVKNVKRYGQEKEPRKEIYIPYTQYPRSRSISLVLRARSGSEPTELADPLRQAVWAVDGNQSIAGVITMQAMFDDTTAQRRFNTWLITLAALLALVLAVLGIHGVLAYFVAQRRREIGLRMALGAQQGDVLRLVLKQGLTLTVIGIAAGLVGAALLTTGVRSFLFGISAFDPITYIGVTVLFLAAAVLASTLPARRAARLDPLIALRQD